MFDHLYIRKIFFIHQSKSVFVLICSFEQVYCSAWSIPLSEKSFLKLFKLASVIQGNLSYEDQDISDIFSMPFISQEIFVFFQLNSLFITSSIEISSVAIIYESKTNTVIPFIVVQSSSLVLKIIKSILVFIYQLKIFCTIPTVSLVICFLAMKNSLRSYICYTNYLIPSDAYIFINQILLNPLCFIRISYLLSYSNQLFLLKKSS